MLSVFFYYTSILRTNDPRINDRSYQYKMGLSGRMGNAGRRIATKALAVSALAGLMGLVKPAAADITFVLQGVTLSDGGSFVGSFTTNDARTTLTSANITSSKNGAFPGFNYLFAAPTSNSTPAFNSTFLRLDSNTGPSSQLQLGFATALSPTGASLTTNGTSYESVQITGAGNRLVMGGRVVAAVAAVPEPSEWAVIGMAITTLGGLMVRARRRKGVVAA